MNSTDYENGDTLWRQVGQGMFGAINLTKQVTRQTKCRVYYISLKGGLTDGFSRQLNRQLKREIKLILNSILAVSRYYSNTISSNQMLRCIDSKTYPLRKSHNGCPERVVPTPQREYHPPINFKYLIHSCHMKFESNSLP